MKTAAAEAIAGFIVFRRACRVKRGEPVAKRRRYRRERLMGATLEGASNGNPGYVASARHMDACAWKRQSQKARNNWLPGHHISINHRNHQRPRSRFRAVEDKPGELASILDKSSNQTRTKNRKRFVRVNSDLHIRMDLKYILPPIDFRLVLL